ncbi:MAG: hypothetical protein JWR75_1977 [Devosia sp.]|nr:hypothetical protein [Devosia sp.]
MSDTIFHSRPGFWDRVASALHELNPLSRQGPSAHAPKPDGLRNGADAAISADWKRCADRHVSISVMLIEIDGYAELRRGHGTEVATRRLVRVAELVRSHIPASSRIVQLSGSGRLVATLPDGPILLARMAAEKIRREALGTIPATSRKAGDSVTIGVAAANPAEAGHRELLDGAVLALGRAVDRGRNRVDSIDLRSELARMAMVG